MKETLFIVNPVAARGAALRAWNRTREELDRAGIEYGERVTTRAGEAAGIAREAIARGTSRVIAVGGDGTLNEVVNGYLDPAGRAVNREAIIGLLPNGTGSDFRRSVGLETSEVAIRAIAQCETRLIDAACIKFRLPGGGEASRFFINVASFGLGGDVSAFVNGWRHTLPRWIGGRARFIAAAIRALERYRNISTRITLDSGRAIEASTNLIVVANGRYAGGGMMLAPQSKLDDGLLDVIITDRATRLDVIKELPRIYRGGYLKNPKASLWHAREVAITTAEPMAIDIDGDMAGYTPAHLTVLPSAVRFAA